MAQFSPKKPVLAKIMPGEEQLHSFNLQIYDWEKNWGIFGGGYSASTHAKLGLLGHLTDQRFILEPPKAYAAPGWIYWLGRIASELMGAGLIGTFIEIGQEQEKELKSFAHKNGVLAFNYHDIARFEMVRRLSTSKISIEGDGWDTGYVRVILNKINQEFHQQLTFIPYDLDAKFLADSVAQDFIRIANGLVSTKQAR